MKYLTLTGMAIALLCGCSNKPPACGDMRATDAAKGLIIDEVRKVLTTSDAYKSEPTAMDAYLKTIQLTLSMVTTDGYDEKAKKHACHGKLAIAAGGANEQIDIDYSTQLTEDKKDDFVIQIAQGAEVIDKLNGTGMQYWETQRYAGTWRGTYSCAAIDGETTGNKAGFKQDVTMMVANGAHASLERTTRGGGIEKLTGAIDTLNRLELSGGGRNTPDDGWRTSFVGDAEPDAINAVGQLMDTQSDRVFRTCQLNLTRQLTKGANAPATNTPTVNNVAK